MLDHTVLESGIGVPLMLFNNCIGHKGSWLLNELPFSAQQDVPFMLLDICIGHKDIWLLHVQFFYFKI